MKQWIWVSIYTVAIAEKSRYNCLQVWGWLAQLQFRIQKVGLHPAPWIIVGSKSSRTWKHTRGPHVTVPMICRSPASLEGYRSFIPTHYWDVKEHWDYDTRNLKFMKKRFGERGAFKDSRAISNSFYLSEIIMKVNFVPCGLSPYFLRPQGRRLRAHCNRPLVF